MSCTLPLQLLLLEVKEAPLNESWWSMATCHFPPSVSHRLMYNELQQRLGWSCTAPLTWTWMHPSKRHCGAFMCCAASITTHVFV